jgi:type IV pilus assembly protein PilA
MLRKLSQRINNEEKGFTLIELLVVILIIGILAAIALPAFLGQQKKGQDADAKSNARNLVSQVESCFATEETYVNCGDAAMTAADTGLSIGAANGQAQVKGPSATPGTPAAAPTATGYTVRAYSKSGAKFDIIKDATTGSTTRYCTPANTGGCKTGNTW